MDISQIFCELIKLNEFDDTTMAYLINVNKSLNNLITKIINNKLSKRHQESVLTGDQISLYSFTLRYITKLLNPTNKLEYDYCRDCYAFGKIKEDICAYDCVITCCGVVNIIPKKLKGLVYLKCECKTLVGHRSPSNRCERCMHPVIKNNIKCVSCQSIPIRYLDAEQEMRRKYLKYKYKYDSLKNSKNPSNRSIL